MLDEDANAAPWQERGAKIAMDNNSGGEDSAAGAASGNHVMPRLIGHRRVHDAMPVDLPHVAAPETALAEMNKIFATAVLTDGEHCRPVVLQNVEEYASRVARTLRVRIIKPTDFNNMLLPLLVKLEERPTGTRTRRLAAWWRNHPRRRHVGEVSRADVEAASTVEQLMERRKS